MKTKMLKRMISIICAVGISASCATGFVSAVGGNSKNGGKAVPTTNIKDESDSFWEDYHLCKENIELILDRPEYGVKENAEYIRKKLASNVKTAEQTIEEKKKKEKERLRKVQENKKKLQELEKKKIEKINAKLRAKSEREQERYKKKKLKLEKYTSEKLSGVKKRKIDLEKQSQLRRLEKEGALELEKTRYNGNRSNHQKPEILKRKKKNEDRLNKNFSREIVNKNLEQNRKFNDLNEHIKAKLESWSSKKTVALKNVFNKATVEKNHQLHPLLCKATRLCTVEIGCNIEAPFQKTEADLKRLAMKSNMISKLLINTFKLINKCGLNVSSVDFYKEHLSLSVKNATKIQAAFRGYNSRKNFCSGQDELDLSKILEEDNSSENTDEILYAHSDNNKCKNNVLMSSGDTVVHANNHENINSNKVGFNLESETLNNYYDESEN